MISLSEIENALARWEGDSLILHEKHFEDRAEALDDIDFFIESAGESFAGTGQLILLRDRAMAIKKRFEEVDSHLLQRLRVEISHSKVRGTAFKNLIETYVKPNAGSTGEHGYDNLDLFINALFSKLLVPDPLLEREIGMVYYQKTPARIVFEMAAHGEYRPGDNFVDIGSGLGQVVILMHLLTGIRASGIEFEPAYCQYAEDCASGLGLSEVRFINENALEDDFHLGTIFFLYTPFVGAMLQQALKLLQHVSGQRRIRIFTYGPCSAIIVLQPWLKLQKGDPKNSNSLCLFTGTDYLISAG